MADIRITRGGQPVNNIFGFDLAKDPGVQLMMEVVSLAADGKSIGEIARETGAPTDYVRKLYDDVKSGKIKVTTQNETASSESSTEERQKWSTQEEERRLRQQKEEEEKRRKAKEAQEAYDKAVKDWETGTIEVKRTRETELKRSKEEWKSNRLRTLEKQFIKEREEAAARYVKYLIHKEQVQDDLTAAKNLSSNEKKTKRKLIEESESQMFFAKQDVDKAKQKMQDGIRAINQDLKQEENRLLREIEARFPLPVKPLQRNYMTFEQCNYSALYSNGGNRMKTAKQIENEGFMQDILDYMDADKYYNAEYILNSVPSIVASGMSINRVSALLTQMSDAGWVNKTVNNRVNYYSLA